VMANAEHEGYGKAGKWHFPLLLSFRDAGLKLPQNDGVDLPISPVDGQSRRRAMFLESYSFDTMV
jgi:hypothetical protein